MFFPKIKLSSLLNNWQLWAGLITVVLIAIGSLQACRADKWKLEAARLDGKLQEQVKDQNLLYGQAKKERATRRIAEAEEKKKRADLEARIQKFQKDTVAAKRVLKKEKAKTATLPPTELVAQINQRIGNESALTGAGLFLFTRLGANNTLDRFKDGEFYLSEYNKQKKAIGDYEAKAASFDTSLSVAQKGEKDNLIGWNDCRETLATAQDDIVAQKKVGKASVWRGRKQGAFWTIIVAGGLKLLGVW